MLNQPDAMLEDLLNETVGRLTLVDRIVASEVGGDELYVDGTTKTGWELQVAYEILRDTVRVLRGALEAQRTRERKEARALNTAHRERKRRRHLTAVQLEYDALRRPPTDDPGGAA